MSVVQGLVGMPDATGEFFQHEKGDLIALPQEISERPVIDNGNTAALNRYNRRRPGGLDQGRYFADVFTPTQLCKNLFHLPCFFFHPDTAIQDISTSPAPHHPL